MDILQSRMARAALKWSFDDLARESGVSRMTVARFEGGQQVSADSIQAMRLAIERAGVELIDDGARSKGGGPGARLAKS